MGGKCYFVASFYAGNLKDGWIRGAYSSRGVASRERDHMERVLGPYSVVKVYDADRVPKGVTLRV